MYPIFIWDALQRGPPRFPNILAPHRHAGQAARRGPAKGAGPAAKALAKASAKGAISHTLCDLFILYLHLSVENMFQKYTICYRYPLAFGNLDTSCWLPLHPWGTREMDMLYCWRVLARMSRSWRRPALEKLPPSSGIQPCIKNRPWSSNPCSLWTTWLESSCTCNFFGHWDWPWCSIHQSFGLIESHESEWQSWRMFTWWRMFGHSSWVLATVSESWAKTSGVCWSETFAVMHPNSFSCWWRPVCKKGANLDLQLSRHHRPWYLPSAVQGLYNAWTRIEFPRQYFLQQIPVGHPSWKVFSKEKQKQKPFDMFAWCNRRRFRGHLQHWCWDWA